MLKRRLAVARLTHFDHQLDQLSRRRSITPPDPAFDPALVETARRLHALRDDAAPNPTVLATIWEDLMLQADIVPGVEPARLTHAPTNGRVGQPAQRGTSPLFDPSRRMRPQLEFATVAVLVLVLVTGYGAYRLAPARPEGSAPQFAGSRGATPATAADVPAPSECRVPPLPLERFIATGVPSAPSLLVSRRQADDGGTIEVLRNDLPVGVPADPVTVVGVNAAVRERLACLNAGDSARTNALYSGDYYFREQAAVGRTRVFGIGAEHTYLTPASVPREAWSVMPDVRDVRSLPNGRVGAIVVTTIPGPVYFPEYFVFAQQGGRWLIDEQAVVSDALETFVLAGEFAFEPASLTVPADTPITLTLRNTSGTNRALVIADLNFRLEVAPGQVVSAVIEAPAGVYAFVNDRPNEQARGMAGTLIAEEFGDSIEGTPIAPYLPVDGSATVTIEANDLVFHLSTIAIPARTAVDATFTNAGSVKHNLSIDALGVAVDVLPGETKTIAVNAPPGNYAYYCAMPGHRDAGMVGTLRVMDQGSPAVSLATPSPSVQPNDSAARRARTALLLLVDTSGSMSYDPRGAADNKIDLAREALRLAARSVAFGDHVGVLAFNDRQRWVLPITAVATDADRVRIDEAIATLTAEGGTEIYPPLAAGFDAIRQVDADVRHVVLLSDGKSRSGTRADYQTLVAGMSAAGVTLSTVAIGADADAVLLQFLAEQGNGDYHFAETATDIPTMTLRAVRADGTPVP